MNKFLTLTCAAMLTPVLAHGAFKLDSRYQDNDGDLIADIPSDASQQVDPSTLVFAYTPVEDPAVYKEVWSEFLDHLAETTGKKVQFFPVQSNAAQIEAMRAGRLHIAGFNTGLQPAGSSLCRFPPIHHDGSRRWFFWL